MSNANGIPSKCSIKPPHPVDECSSHGSLDSRPALPIDGDRLLERCLGNVKCTRTLLEEFVTTSSTDLDVLDAELAAGNYAAISATAHSLKGVAGILFANTLQEISSQLESAANEADGKRTRELIQQLHHETQRVIEFIPRLRTAA